MTVEDFNFDNYKAYINYRAHQDWCSLESWLLQRGYPETDVPVDFSMIVIAVHFSDYFLADRLLHFGYDPSVIGSTGDTVYEESLAGKDLVLARKTYELLIDWLDPRIALPETLANRVICAAQSRFAPES